MTKWLEYVTHCRSGMAFGLGAALNLVIAALLSGGCGAVIQRETSPDAAALSGLDGKPVDPFVTRPRLGIVLAFVSADCPISNRMLPELNQLAVEFEPRGFKFWLVYVDRSESLEVLRRHQTGYDIRFEAVSDSTREWVRRSKVQVTPEVAVYRSFGQLVYHGRINDLYGDVLRSRTLPTRHDLREVLETMCHRQVITRRSTRAVGCYIRDLP